MAYRDVYRARAREYEYKLKLLAVNPGLDDGSGIYFLTRKDEEGIRYAYIGQARHILRRLCGHMDGYSQHIDLSLRKHGLWSPENQHGWKVGFLHYAPERLDEMERKYIKEYADAGYQLRNKSRGGQGAGRGMMDETKPARKYRDGLEQGYRNAAKEVAHLFELHLDYRPKSDRPNKNQVKAMEKFAAFLDAGKKGAGDGKTDGT